MNCCGDERKDEWALVAFERVLPFSLRFIVVLFVVQLTIQIVTAIVRVCTNQPRHPLIVLGTILLGLCTVRTKENKNLDLNTLENSSIYRYLIRLILPLGSCMFTLVFFYSWNFVTALFVGIVFSFLILYSPFYIMLSLYFESYGIGLNFYYNSIRVLGVDWHRFLMKQNVYFCKTTKKLKIKFLPKEDQYFVNRPHIDLPTHKIHHWPWMGWKEEYNGHCNKDMWDERKKKNELCKQEKLKKLELKKQIRKDRLARKTAVVAENKDSNKPESVDDSAEDDETSILCSLPLTSEA